MGFSLKGVFQSAVGAAPYAQRAIAQRQAEDEADQQRNLSQLYAAMRENREQSAASMAYQQGAANILHTNAETDKLRQPTPPTKNIMKGPGGALIDLTDAEHPRTVAPAIPKPPAPEPVVPIMQGGKRVYAPRSQAAGKEAPAPNPPAGDRTLVQIQGEDGNPIWVPREQAIGKQAKTTTRVESATNTAAQARLEAAVSEMNNAHANMSEYETKLATGKARIGASGQLLSRVANAFTHDDPISQLTQSGALAALNQTDPELARYIRRGLSFAEGESMVSQRPSDFRTRMAAFLSTAAANASPEMIQDIAGRRTAILNPLNKTIGGGKSPAAGNPAGRGRSAAAASANVPHPANRNDPGGNIDLRTGRGGSGGPGNVPAATREQQLWDAAVKKHGEAKVLQEYGSRPEDEE